MYEKYFGFSEKPFSLTPDPHFLFLAGPHRKALTLLEYSLVNSAPFCLITGEVGSGKTTLIRKLLEKVEQDTTVGLISNTSASFSHLLQWVCMTFSLPYSGKSDVELYDTFTRFLIDEYARGRKTLLIVDETQNLSAQMLEELRVLSNINADKHLLLQTILVGQPELRGIIRRPSMLQLAQRIGADFHLGPLSAVEARNYVYHRLRVAGGRLNIFSPAAVELAYEHSGGIPRLINQLCDRALVYGYGEQRPRIDAHLMKLVVDEHKESGLLGMAPATT